MNNPMRTNSMTLLFGSFTLTASALLSAAAVLGTSTSVLAQAEVPSVAPYKVAPTSDDVKIRASYGPLWYVITSVGPSSVLNVDGEIDGWLRIEYPPGTPVLVKTTDAELSADRSTVRLTRRPRLRAWNRDLQFTEECYRAVVLDDVPAPGSEMKYIQSVKNREGDVAGYLVEAPRGTKGFVLATDVRRLSSDEAARLNKPATPEPAPTTPAPTATQPAPEATPTPAPAPTTQPAPQPTHEAPVANQPVSQPVQPPVSNPAPTEQPTPQPQPQTQPQPTQPVHEAPQTTPAPTNVTPAPATVPAESVTPAVSTPAPTETTTQPLPAPTQPAPAPAPTQPAAPARLWSLQELDGKFDEISAQPIHAAEYEQLINEYQRYSNALPRSTAYNRERQYVEARVELLKMKLQLRQHESELTNLKSNAEQVTAAAGASADRIERSREYQVVGRLMPSSIYDGKRLPLMYRVQAAEGGRTLAYVTPDDALALDTKLGMIVGVKGKGSLDPSARVNIIQATAVEVLDPKTGLPATDRATIPTPAKTETAAPTTNMQPRPATPFPTK